MHCVYAPYRHARADSLPPQLHTELLKNTVREPAIEERLAVRYGIISEITVRRSG